MISLHKVFVYGTLMRGERNHHLLDGEGAELVCATQTASAEFQMVVNPSSSSPDKWTPSVYRIADGFHIAGELYHVNDKVLDNLDELEAVGVNYDREEIDLHDGTRAWMYLKRDYSNGIVDSSLRHYDRTNHTLRWCEYS